MAGWYVPCNGVLTISRGWFLQNTLWELVEAPHALGGHLYDGHLESTH